jgi:hypothetical protein
MAYRYISTFSHYSFQFTIDRLFVLFDDNLHQQVLKEALREQWSNQLLVKDIRIFHNQRITNIIYSYGQ